MTGPEKIMKSKPIVIAGGFGGATTSTSVAAVADALGALGYRVRLGDADIHNPTLSKMVAATPLDPEKDDVRKFVSGGFAEDITIIDAPLCCAKLIAANLESVPDIDLVGALTINEPTYTHEGACELIEAFADRARFIIFANGRDSEGGKCDPADLPEFLPILALAKGRVITIPRWTPRMSQQFNKTNGAPADYIPGGRFAGNSFDAAAWRHHRNQVIASTAGVAEWLFQPRQ